MPPVKRSRAGAVGHEEVTCTRSGRQKVTVDDVSDAMVHVSHADGRWIGAVTMAVGMAWNWIWHRNRNDA